MSNYIPRSGAAKKKDFLAKYEAKLIGEMRWEELTAEQVEAAERVRAAYLGVLKGKRELIVPNGVREIPLYKKIDQEADRWKEMTAGEIVQFYRKKLKKSPE